MTAIAFTENTLHNVKRALKASFTAVKSSYLTEALAAACGYRTHAALLADLDRSNQSDPDFIALDDEAFIRRLYELDGQSVQPNEDFEWFEFLKYSDKNGIISTKSTKFYEIEYKSERAKVWRNMMVAGINAGIEKRLFTVLPNDNRWPGAAVSEHDRHLRPTFNVFHFDVGSIPAIGYVSDAGFDELSIHVMFWPNEKGEEWIRVYDAGFVAGDAFAAGWFERRDGAWLQSASDFNLSCRRKRLAEIAALEIVPRGFADRGNFKM
jgi:hypothetical protein